MRIKTTPDFYFFTCIGLSILVHFLFPVLKIVSYPYSMIGIVFIVTGISISFFTNAMLLKKGTSIKPFGSPTVLLVSGPFNYSRNPIYLSMAFALFGVGIFLGSLSPFIFPMVFVVIIDKRFIRLEEHKLEKQFGEKYLDYKGKVNRWIGR